MATLEEKLRFTERRVCADGFEISLWQAGHGDPIAWFHGAGGLYISPALKLLAERFAVSAFQLPGFGDSAENLRSGSLDELAATMAHALDAAGLTPCTLYGTSFGAAVALRLALAEPEAVSALVLESPAALRPENATRGTLTPDQLRVALFARPENAPPPAPPEVMAKQLRLVERLSGPAQDPQLLERMGSLRLPVLLLFGTRDGLIPPSMGPLYRDRLVNSNLVYVYDAAHEMQFDRPEAVAGLVADFATRQEAFVVGATSTVINP